jgi:glycogen synthase
MVRVVEKVRIQTFTRFGDMSIWRDEIPGEVPVYLLEKEKYFDRDYIYGEPGQAYQDNAERFSFLSGCP